MEQNAPEHRARGFAASCQRRSARTGQSSVVPYGMATVAPLPVRSPLERGRVRRRPRSLASRCSTRIAASSARRSAPAKPTSNRARSRSPAIGMPARIWRRMSAVAASFLAGSSPASAASRCMPARVAATWASAVGHRPAGDEVQVADGGAAQLDGVDGQGASAFGGEEGDDVFGAGGQAGQLVAGAPGVVRFGKRAPPIRRRCPPASVEALVPVLLGIQYKHCQTCLYEIPASFLD